MMTLRAGRPRARAAGWAFDSPRARTYIFVR